MSALMNAYLLIVPGKIKWYLIFGVFYVCLFLSCTSGHPPPVDAEKIMAPFIGDTNKIIPFVNRALACA